MDTEPISKRDQIAALAEQTLIQIAWDQWGALGIDVPGGTHRPELSLVDPEALLLISLYLLPSDRELKEPLDWWVGSASALTSIHRLRRLLTMFPTIVERRLQHLAALAVATGDCRWKALIRTVRRTSKSMLEPRGLTPAKDLKNPTGPVIRSTVPRPIDIMNPAALILRVRLLFGVGPRADLITCMLSRGGQTATARELLNTTAYGTSAVYRILDELAGAGIVARTKSRPATYQICSEAWQEVLGRSVIQHDVKGKVGFRRGYLKKTAAPMWLCWPQLFSYLATLSEACRAEGREQREGTPDLESASRLYTEYRRTFLEQRLALPPLHFYWLREDVGLRSSVDAIGRWYRVNA